MNEYIRTKYCIYKVEKKDRAYFEGQPLLYYCKGKYVEEKNVLNKADNIKDLIEIGDLVAYYNTNSKRYEYTYIHNEDELFAIKHLPINNLFMKVGDNFVLVASAKDKEELEVL